MDQESVEGAPAAVPRQSPRSSPRRRDGERYPVWVLREVAQELAKLPAAEAFLREAEAAEHTAREAMDRHQADRDGQDAKLLAFIGAGPRGRELLKDRQTSEDQQRLDELVAECMATNDVLATATARLDGIWDAIGKIGARYRMSSALDGIDAALEPYLEALGCAEGASLDPRFPPLVPSPGSWPKSFELTTFRNTSDARVQDMWMGAPSPGAAFTACFPTGRRTFAPARERVAAGKGRGREWLEDFRQRVIAQASEGANHE